MYVYIYTHTHAYAYTPNVHTYVYICIICTHLLLFSHAVVSDSFVTTWTVVHLASLSMGFPSQEYWSGLPFPPPGDLPYSEIKPMPPMETAMAGGFFTAEPPGNAYSRIKLLRHADPWPWPQRLWFIQWGRNSGL